MTGPAHIFDKPNRYIGKPEPRADAARLLQGRGSYVDDQKLPRMAHAAFVRSPHAHAKILSIDTEGARAATGVVAVYSGEDLARHDPSRRPSLYAAAPSRGRCGALAR